MTSATVVVGASGRLGSMVRRAWKTGTAGPGPVAYQGRRGGSGSDIAWPDLSDARPLADWANRNAPISTLIMLAGTVPGMGRSMGENVAIARACLDAALEVGARRVLLASSSAVYGRGRPAAFSEDYDAHPVSAYGLAKLAMESMSRDYSGRLQVCNLRIGNVAGADALLGNVGDLPVRLERFSDGHAALRSYIGPRTFAETLAALCDPAIEPPFLLNVATPRPVYLEELMAAAHVDWQWEAGQEPDRQYIALDCSRAVALCPFLTARSGANALVDEWKTDMGGR
jgi:UDP-glucose 4-epimerase